MDGATTEAATDIGIEGMTCASCVGRVERALQRVPGVQVATVNLATESARVLYAPGEESVARIRRAVREAGYEPRAADAVFAEDLCMQVRAHFMVYPARHASRPEVKSFVEWLREEAGEYRG